MKPHERKGDKCQNLYFSLIGQLNRNSSLVVLAPAQPHGPYELGVQFRTAPEAASFQQELQDQAMAPGSQPFKIIDTRRIGYIVAVDSQHVAVSPVPKKKDHYNLTVNPAGYNSQTGQPLRHEFTQDILIKGPVLDRRGAVVLDKPRVVGPGTVIPASKSKRPQVRFPSLQPKATR